MASQAYPIREGTTSDGENIVLAWSEGLGLHIRIGNRLVGWQYSTSELADYEFEKYATIQLVPCSGTKGA